MTTSPASRKSPVRRESFNPLLKSYPDSRRINAVSEGAENLYTRLLAGSDDAGRYYGDAGWVLAKLYTARMVAGQVDHEEIERRLSELEGVGLIRRYQVAGDAYLEMVDVFKTLRKDVKPQVIFPEQVTESVTDAGRTRDEPVTDSHENGPLDPTQPNPPCTNPTHSSSRRKLRFDDVDRELASWMWALIEAMQPERQPPHLENWANDFRLLREVDGRSPEKIKSLFERAHRDQFWRNNILSPVKLREKWDDLALKLDGANSRGDNGSSPGKIHTGQYDSLPANAGVGSAVGA